MLTSMVLTAVLLQAPAEEPGHDLSVSVELTGGRQLGVASFVDYDLVPDVLTLNAGYSLFKPPALAATATAPALATAPTHAFFAGADWSVTSRFTLSGLFSASPKAVDSVVLNPSAPLATRVTVSTSRSSVGGSLMGAWSSSGLSRLEWVVDGGVSGTANRLGRGVTIGRVGTQTEDPLVVLRGLLGLTLTILDQTDVCLRGGLSAYTADPLTAGRFDATERQEIQRGAATGAATFTTEVEALARAAQQATSRLGQADSLSGYASAPVWAELKLSVLHRFGSHWSAQLGWTYDRYVPTAGWANILSSRVALKLASRWRLWLAGALQLEQAVDHPATGTPPSISGTASLGAELTL